MKKNTSNRKINGFLLAFWILALLFLAVSAGTAGSFRGAGEAYEFEARQSGDQETPCVVFYIKSPVDVDEDGHETTVRAALSAVYLNIAQIYADEGTPAVLRLERSSSNESYMTGSGLDGVIENFYTPEPSEENQKPLAPTATDAFFNYVMPFEFPESGWNISTYHYFRLFVKGTNGENPNVLVNEVVFVGEELDSSNNGTGKFRLLEARVESATPHAHELSEDARKSAEALIDSQPSSIPGTAASSFDRFGGEEQEVLMTIAEMRRGSTFATNGQGEPADVYHGDRVYGAFGLDILALGTLIFGMSPFGLRIFPVLAAFGALVILSRFAAKLFKSEKAGLIFALLYILGGMPFVLGRLGTPLMLGVFFFSAALSLVYRFYSEGVEAKALSVLPLLGGGLLLAAAVCTNGAFLIPAAGVAGLFVAGMVRQQTAKRYRLEKALSDEEETEEPKEVRAAKIVSGYRFRNTAVPILFGAGFLFGIFLLSLVGILPSYYAYLKLYDDPASPAMNVFSLAWKTFAGGFTGSAFGAKANFLYFELFRGQGEMHAVTAAFINPVALILAIAGLVLAVVNLVLLLKNKTHDKVWRAGMRRNVILLTGFVLSLVLAVSLPSPAPFILLSYLFAFLSAGGFASYEGKGAKALGITAVVLLAAGFAAFAVLAFSVPLPAAFIDSLFV